MWRAEGFLRPSPMGPRKPGTHIRAEVLASSWATSWKARSRSSLRARATRKPVRPARASSKVVSHSTFGESGVCAEPSENAKNAADSGQKSPNSRRAVHATSNHARAAQQRDEPRLGATAWLSRRAACLCFSRGPAMAKSVEDRGPGARLARRDEGASCWYVTEEQRSQAGRIGRESDRLRARE
jgi:hypothetical protein